MLMVSDVGRDSVLTPHWAFLNPHWNAVGSNYWSFVAARSSWGVCDVLALEAPPRADSKPSLGGDGALT
eukprot:8585418-Pyramimonas_sp.AAC.1